MSKPKPYTPPLTWHEREARRRTWAFTGFFGLATLLLCLLGLLALTGNL